jgi:hypothetical protein
MTLQKARFALAGVWFLILECAIGMLILAIYHHWIGASFLAVQGFSLVPSAYRIAGWIDANRSSPINDLKHIHYRG